MLLWPLTVSIDIPYAVGCVGGNWPGYAGGSSCVACVFLALRLHPSLQNATATATNNIAPPTPPPMPAPIATALDELDEVSGDAVAVADDVASATPVLNPVARAAVVGIAVARLWVSDVAVWVGEDEEAERLAEEEEDAASVRLK